MLLMNKRDFLAAGALGVALSSSATATAPAETKGPTLLTVSGEISRRNRGPLDKALDQLLLRHGVTFDSAWAFDAAMLLRLPAVEIMPTLEYDGKPHRLRGPLLSSVLEAAGVAADAPRVLTLRAVDGYAVSLSLADVRKYRMVVASSVDGSPMGLGGLGPLWAVVDADRLPAFKDKPLKERFSLCPWALYAIEVKAA